MNHLADRQDLRLRSQVEIVGRNKPRSAKTEQFFEHGHNGDLPLATVRALQNLVEQKEHLDIRRSRVL